jgi:hypothetical protein
VKGRELMEDLYKEEETLKGIVMAFNVDYIYLVQV